VLIFDTTGFLLFQLSTRVIYGLLLDTLIIVLIIASSGPILGNYVNNCKTVFCIVRGDIIIALMLS